MADVVVERNSEQSSSGPLVAIIVIAILVVAALIFLPGLLGSNTTGHGSNSGTNTNNGVSVPTGNTTTPTTNP